MHSHRILAVVLALASTACAVPRGRMPPTPSYYDLINDGSPERQEELRQKFQVHPNLWGVNVGDTVRAPGRVDGPTPDDWYPVHPDVQAFLAGDKEVVAALPNRILYSTAFGASVVGGLALVAVPAVLGATVGVMSGLLVGSKFFANVPFNGLPREGQAAVAGASGVGIAALFGLVGVPLLVGGVVGLVWLNKQFIAATDLWNRNLDKRIADAATTNKSADSAAPVK